MNYPQTGKDLLELFGDLSGAGFKDHVFLTDTKVGFSIQIGYPGNIRFKPAKTSSGEDDTVAVIWVVYEDSRETDGRSYIPLRLRISTLSKYRQKHLFDYDVNDPDRPTAESMRLSKLSPQPIELSMRGYFVDGMLGTLVDEKQVEVSGLDILNNLFNAHCNSVHPVRGLPFWGAELAHGVYRGALDKLIDGTKWMLHAVFGRSLAESQQKSSFYDGYERGSLGKYPEDSIDFAGHRFSKRLLPLALLLYALGAWYSWPVQDKSYMDYVIRSEVLSSIHVLGFLVFLEEVLPLGLFYILNGLILCRKFYLSRRLQSSF